eukprot:jgi/Mesvir1/24598/Mv21916-RA.2
MQGWLGHRSNLASNAIPSGVYWSLPCQIAGKPFRHVHISARSRKSVPRCHGGAGNQLDSGIGGGGTGGAGGGKKSVKEDGGKDNGGHKRDVVIAASVAVALGSAFVLGRLGETTRHAGDAGPDGVPSTKLKHVWETDGFTRRYFIALGDNLIVRHMQNGADAGTAAHDMLPGPLGALGGLLAQGRHLLQHILLPEGYPASVTSDYTSFMRWRVVQVLASQVNGVLCTNAMLVAVGLGKGSIPTAATVNWVVKDGLGYLTKLWVSRFGGLFDVDPKGWRLLADILENASYALELATATMPRHFLLLAGLAGCLRAAAAMTQSATRIYFNASFAARGNLADIAAKAEAQGMLSKSLGIGIGIAVASRLGDHLPPMAATFFLLAAVHLFANLRSYEAVQLRTLNPQRATLLLERFVRTGHVVDVADAAKQDTVSIPVPWHPPGKSDFVQLGVPLSRISSSRSQLAALFALHRDDRYLLGWSQGAVLVALREGYIGLDILKAMLQAAKLWQLAGGELADWTKDHGGDGLAKGGGQGVLPGASRDTAGGRMSAPIRLSDIQAGGLLAVCSPATERLGDFVGG